MIFLLPFRIRVWIYQRRAGRIRRAEIRQRGAVTGARYHRWPTWFGV